MFDLLTRVMTAEIERDLRARRQDRLARIGATFPPLRTSPYRQTEASSPPPKHRPVDSGIAEPS